MNKTGRQLLPLLITFIITAILIFIFTPSLRKNSIDPNILSTGNLFFLLLSVVSFYIQRNGLENSNPHVFVRSVMAGMMLKMALTVVAVFIYIYLSGPAFNKRAIFVSLFFYLLYLAVEVKVVMKMNKNKKTNA